LRESEKIINPSSSRRAIQSESSGLAAGKGTEVEFIRLLA
jgi:hypothetical protein